MSLIDAITGAIANPHRVRDCQNRASERMYRGLDKKMKAVRDISPEAPVTIEENLIPFSPTSSRAPSRAQSHHESPERRSRPMRPRPELQRSQSELPVEAVKLRPKQIFTPCITANELTSDQLQRNYSHDDVQKWDRIKSPLPPLFPMQGVGRYRHSVSADPQWRNEHFKKQIESMDGLADMVATLDMSEVGGLSQDEWQDLTSMNCRRGSAISSNSTRTTSSTGLHESIIDPKSGVRISRGFSPAPSSSTRSSFNAPSRKGSTLSVVAKPIEGDSSLFQKSLQRQSTVMSCDRRSSVPLSTINEQANAPGLADSTKKFERACDFTDIGDPDSAVTSDVDDSEAVWTDEAEPAKVSLIAQMLKDGKKPEPQPALSRVRTTSSDKKRGRASTASIDRHKTVRQAPSRRRKSSKTRSLAQPKTKPDKKKTDELMLPTPESPDDGHELILQLRKPARDAFEKQKRVDKSSIEIGDVSDNDTLVAEHQLEYQPRAPRNRASTAFVCKDKIVVPKASQQKL